MAAMIYLDTHVVVWLYAGLTTRLRPAARDLLNTSDLAISPMVCLELQYLYETGRTTEPGGTVVQDLDGLVAERPHDAVRMGREHKGPIHLLLTDVVMPDMSGPALAAEITRMYPEAKVLFMTGYADREVTTPGGRSSRAPMLMKPFSLDVLASTVRRVLDGGVVKAGG